MAEVVAVGFRRAGTVPCATGGAILSYATESSRCHPALPDRLGQAVARWRGSSGRISARRRRSPCATCEVADLLVRHREITCHLGVAGSAWPGALDGEAVAVGFQRRRPGRLAETWTSPILSDDTERSPAIRRPGWLGQAIGGWRGCRGRISARRPVPCATWKSRSCRTTREIAMPSGVAGIGWARRRRWRGPFAGRMSAHGPVGLARPGRRRSCCTTERSRCHTGVAGIGLGPATL